MKETVRFNEDGYTDLKLEKNRNYIITKWYGSSLAIFEESAFQKYIGRLGTDVEDGDHGRSVIRYFLSAAVTMMAEDENGWQIPPILLACIRKGNEPVESWLCNHEGKYQDTLPMMILASQSNMDSAIEMTAKRH